MAVIRAFVALLAIALPTPLAQAETKSISKNPDQFVDGTSLERAPAAIAINRFNRQRLPFGLTISEAATTTKDTGNIAVLEDDGTVLVQPNRFDLTDKTVNFTPAGTTGYSITTQTGSFDSGAGNPTQLVLDDDDSKELPLPFSFTFYGVRYSSVFINTDGNLTFTKGDSESTERNLARIMAGVPRIAPWFDDLNPTGGARITVENLSDRVIFTWTDVGEWVSGSTSSRGKNTFQAVLMPNGSIRFNFRTLEATNGIVALAPGATANAENSLIDFAAQLVPATFRGLIAEIFASRLTMDDAQVPQIFYRTHPDAYDGLFIFADFNISLGNAFAFAIPTRNDVRGIINTRTDVYDYGAAFGSKQRLSVVVNMGDLSRYPGDPQQRFLGANNSLSILGQEFGHRWIAFMNIESPDMLGRDRSHWSFLMNTSASVVEGNEIEDLGSGRFRTVRAVERYGPLDQYIMGLRPASEVPPWFVITDPVLPRTFPPGTPSACRSLDTLPSCSPFVGLELEGVRRDVTIDDVIAKLGARSPGHDQAQKDFRVAFILVTQRGQAPRQAAMEQLDNWRSQWETFFRQAVDGRGTMTTRILYTAPQISSISPARGSIQGGDIVTISGSGFQENSTVTIGGRAVDVTFRDANTLVITTPSRPEGPGTVSIVVTNPRDAQSATLTAAFTYFSSNSVAEVRANLTATGSRHIETRGVGTSTQVGYATVDSAFGISVFQSRSGSDVRSEAAVPAAVIGTSFRVYAERTDRTSTGLAIVNTATTATITVQLSDRRQATIQLPTRGQKALFIHELFPDIGTAFGGSAAVTSNVPIGVIALRGSLNLANEFIIATVPIAAGSPSTDTAVFPQIVDGSGYVTELILLNPGTTTITGSLEFSFSVSTTDRGTNTRFTYEIPARGSWKLRTLGTRSDVQAGYASVVPASGNVAPAATAILKQSTGNNLNFEAGVPATRALARGVMFGVRDSAHETVLAMAGTASIRLTAYSLDGTAIGSPTTVDLRGHSARFLRELMPSLPSSFEGTVRFEASSPINVITLRTLVNASGAFLMTPMPVIDLTQSAPAVSYFPQLVDGGNFTTEFLLLNLTAATARIQFFNTEGVALPLTLR